MTPMSEVASRHGGKSVTLRHKRGAVLGAIFLASGFFIWMGLDGWTISSVPAHYVGCATIAIGVAGLCGVNIWHGGPLDPRNDSESAERPEAD